MQIQNGIDYVALIPIALSVLAAAGSGYAWIKSGKRRDADAASVLTGVALEMVNEVQDQYKSLKNELNDYKTKTDQRIADQARIIADQARRISDQDAKISEQSRLIAKQAATLEEYRKEIENLRSENNRLKSPKRRGGL